MRSLRGDRGSSTGALSVSGALTSGSYSVAGAWHRLDQRRLAELCAQTPDRPVDGRRERIGVLVPDVLEQLLGRDDAPARAEQMLEHGELLRAEREASPIA